MTAAPNPVSTSAAPAPTRRSWDVVVAWACTAMLPLALLSLVTVSERTGWAEGVPGALPGWTLALTVVLVLGLAVGALVLGGIANRRGRTSGLVPAVVGAAVLGYFAFMLTLAAIGHGLLGWE